MKFFSIKSINYTILKVTKRFPLVIIAILFAVISFIISIENGENANGLFISLGFTCCLAVISFLNVKLYYEKYQLSKWSYNIVIGLIIILLSIYFYYQYDNNFEELKLIIRFWGVLMSLLLIASYIPYVRKEPIIYFANYNMTLITRLLESFLFVLILFGTMSLAIVSIEQLFDLSYLKSKHYFQLFILLVGIIQGTYFLSNYPLDFNRRDNIQFGKSFGVLCHYILIPILILYLLISYAYMIKLLATGNWVQDWYITMIIWYFVIGIISYLFNYAYQNQVEHKWSDRLIKYFYPVSFPLSVMLLFSVYKRIEKEGITEEQYVLAALAIWIFGTCLYFIISKIDNIRILPISLSVIVFLSVIGPLNMFKVSIDNQWSRLERNLTNVGALSGGVLKPINDEIDGEAYYRISSSLQYLYHNDQLEDIHRWDINKLLASYKKEDVSDITILNLLNISSEPVIGTKEEFINYSGTDNYFLDLDSFNYIVPVVEYENEIKSSRPYLLLDREKQVFILDFEQRKYEYNIPDIGIFTYDKNLDEKQAHFWLKNNEFEILVKVIYLSGIKKNGKYTLESIQANAFVREL